MSEYIDREALKAAFHTDMEQSQSFDIAMFELLMIEMDEMPIADVAPIIHARWETRPSGENGSGEMKAFCSHCGKPNKQYKPPYCPHCGVRMKGEKP